MAVGGDVINGESGGGGRRVAAHAIALPALSLRSHISIASLLLAQCGVGVWRACVLWQVCESYTHTHTQHTHTAQEWGRGGHWVGTPCAVLLLQTRIGAAPFTLLRWAPMSVWRGGE